MGLARPVPVPEQTDVTFATANPNLEHTFSHNLGIYVWGAYQARNKFEKLTADAKFTSQSSINIHKNSLLKQYPDFS